jgi:hypothetical protein
MNPLMESILLTAQEIAKAVQMVCQVQLSPEGQLNMKAWREGNQRAGEDLRKFFQDTGGLLKKMADNITDVFDGDDQPEPKPPVNVTPTKTK